MSGNLSIVIGGLPICLPFALAAGQLLPGVAGVAPDRFLRVKGFEILHEGHQLPLVLRLHRLAAQQGEARDIVRLAGGEHLVADGLVEGLAIAEIPCHLIEAAGAVVAAAGNEDAGADTRPVGDVAFLLFCFYCSKSMILFRDEVTFLFILDDLVCSYPAA